MYIKYSFSTLFIFVLGIIITKIEGKAIKRDVQGSFTILSYNVAGLPNIYAADKTRQISDKLNKYDVVHIQEDFAYNNELTSNLKFPYRSDFSGSIPVGDGLMVFTKFPLYTNTRIPWTNTHGFISNGADENIPKGFMYSAIEVSPGCIIDIYNLHTDADTDEQSLKARRSNMIQLANYITTRSAGKAVIVFGDTNSRYTRVGDDFEELVLKPCNLKDAWVQNVMGGVAPAKGSAPLMVNQLGQRGEVVDKIWFRSGKDLEINAATFEILFNEFTDKNGNQLSDHYPVAARIDYKYLNLYLTTNTFGGSGGQGFSFLEQMDGKLPKNIFIAAGDRIDLVGFTYESGPAMAGGNGGKWYVYNFSAGEYIKSIRIGKAAKNALSSKRVSYITFRTNFGGSFTVGKAAKEVKDFYAPDGYAIAGFIGAARDEIDRLGVIYLKIY